MEAGGWVPKTDEEKAKAAKGLAPWKGRWISASYRERLRKKADDERRARMEQQKARRLWRNHAEVKSRRFLFKHTLPDDVFAEFQDLFETYYDFFTKYWRIRPQAGFGKPEVNIYHDQEYFLQVSGAPKGVVGWYSPIDRELHFFYDRENRDFAIDVMFHEGNHMLTHMIDKRFRYPWWISEGMAEYFGASEWDPEKKTMTLGKIQSARLAVLHTQIKDKKWLKLKDLLVSRGMGAIEYSWTWSFCHFMLHTPRYEKKFKRLYLGLARDSGVRRTPIFLDFRTVQGNDSLDAFKKYLKVRDIEALQQEWYDYIKDALAFDRNKVNWADAGWMMSLYGEKAKARLFFK